MPRTSSASSSSAASSSSHAICEMTSRLPRDVLSAESASFKVTQSMLKPPRVTVMSDILKAIGRFEAALAVTPAAWLSLDIRAVAIRRGNSWHNVLTLVRLDPRPVESLPSPEILAQTASMTAVRTTMRREALSKLIEEVQLGQATLGLTTLEFISESRGASPAPYGYAYAKIATTLEDQPTGGPTLVGHELVVSGDNASTVLGSSEGGLEQLSEELRASSEPWDGFAALMEHAIGTRRRFDNYSEQLCVSAPLPVRFRTEELRLRNTTLAFTVEAKNSSLAAYCSVGFVATLKNELGERGVLVPHPTRGCGATQDASIWTEVRENLVGQRVTLFARIGTFVVDRTTVVDEILRVQRPLVRAYETIDPEFELLSGWLLAPRRSDQVEFERAVARVFLFCGFLVDSFAGDSRLSDAVDLIPHAPSQKVLLVIEYTTGPLQSRDGKLSRLVQRAVTVSDALAVDGEPASETAVVPRSEE